MPHNLCRPLALAEGSVIARKSLISTRTDAANEGRESMISNSNSFVFSYIMLYISESEWISGRVWTRIISSGASLQFCDFSRRCVQNPRRSHTLAIISVILCVSASQTAIATAKQATNLIKVPRLLRIAFFVQRNIANSL